MASIDERIVRMTFDNAKFEAAVQTTLKTLDNLKSALNLDKAGAGFEKLEKASNKVNFSHMSDSLDQISNRFSTFGIVGMTVLQDLTRTAMNTAKSLLSSLTSPLIEGGKRRALNIEQAKFQIQGLGYAWEDVEEDINYGVKNTAYGLDSAAKAASQLLASNVKVGDSMKAALRGISGVAAMTSSEYDDIARVFTTVAGNGRLMGDQLNQLSARGLNVAATLGSALGKTEGEIREMVSKGQIDFATFSKAMDDAFGEHAKKANDTFTGSLSNMKAALSRIGAEFATPAYTNLRLAMNALTPAIDDVKKSLKPLIETASKAMEAASKLAVDILGKLDLQATLAGPMEAANKVAIAFGKTIVNLGTAIYRIVAPIVRSFEKAFGGTLLDILVRASNAIANFTSQLVISDRMSNNIERTFTGVFTILSVVADVLSRIAELVATVLFSAATGTFGFIADITLSITGILGDLIVGIKQLVDDILSLRIFKVIGDAITNALEAIGFASDVAYKGVQGFADSLFDKTFETSALVLTKIAEAIKFVAAALDEAIFKAVDFIKSLGELPVVRRVIQKTSDAFGTLRTNISYVSSIAGSKLVKAFEKVRTIIGQVVTKVRDLIEKYANLPTLQEAVTKVIDFSIEVFHKAVEIFEKVKTVLGDIVDRIKELSSASFAEVVKNFKELRNKIGETVDMAGKLEWVKSLFYDIRDGLIDMSNTSGSVLNRVKEKLAQFIEWVESKFSNISLGNLIAAGAGGSMIAFMLSFSKFLGTAEKLADTARKTFDKISGLPGAVANVMNEFAKTMKAKRESTVIDSISGLIKNIAMLAAAIAVLATMDQDKVRSSAIVIGILGASLIAVSGLMQAISASATPDQVAKASALVLSIGGAMAILVVALKILSTINMDGIELKLVVMGVLMAELTAFTVALNKFTPEIVAGMPSIMAISFALVLLTRAMGNIAGMDTSSLLTSVTTLGILMTMMAIISRMASAANADKGALAFLGMATAIVLIVEAVRKISDMDPEKATAGVGAIIILMGALEVFMMASAAAGKYADKAGIALLLVGVSLNLIAEAIKRMAGIDQDMIQTATDVISRVMIMFALLTAMTRLAGENGAQAGIAIALMSGSLILIAGAIAILSKIDPEGLKRGTDAITQIMAMMALLVASTGVIKEANKTITTITICIAALAGALAVLSLLEPENLKTAAEALNTLILCFTILVASTAIAERANSAIIPLVAVVGILALVLRELVKLDKDMKPAIIAAEAISLLVLSLTAAVAVLQFVELGAAVEGIAALAIIIGVVGTVLAALGALNTYLDGALGFIESGIPMLEAIGEGIGRFVGALAGGLAGGAMEAFSNSLVNFGENLSAFAEAVKPFLETMSNIPNSAVDGVGKIVRMMLMIAGAELMNSLAEAFSFFTGNMSIVELFQIQLPQLAEGMKSFIDKLGVVDVGKLSIASDAAKKLAEMMAAMPRSGGVVQFFTGEVDMQKLSSGLISFGVALTAYSTAVKNLDASSIEASIEPAKSVIEISKMISAEGGILQDWIGSQAQGMSALSGNLEDFGKALVAYGDVVVDLKADKVNDSIGPAKSIIEVASAIAAEGGILQDWIGSQAQGMSELSGNLGDFGKALVTYADTVKDLNTGSVDKSIAPAQALIELSQLIGEEGGFLQAVFGSESQGFSSFNENVEDLANALVTFANETADMPDSSNAITVAEHLAGVWEILASNVKTGTYTVSDSFEDFAETLGSSLHIFADETKDIKLTGGQQAAITVAKALAAVYKEFDTSGGAAGFWFGDSANTFDNFADNVGALGQGLSRFCWYAGGIKTDGVDEAVHIVEKLAEIYNSVESSGGWAAIVGGDQTETIREGLPALGEALAKFAANITGEKYPDMDQVRVVIGVLRALAESFGSGNWSDMQSIGYTIGYIGEGLKVFSDNMAQVDFERVANGMRNLNGMSATINNLVGTDTSGIDRIKEAISSFMEVVNNDFIKGLDDKIKEVTNKATKLGTSAGDAFQMGLGTSDDKFKFAGATLMTQLISGMEGAQSTANTSVTGIMNGLVTTINWSGNQFTDAGKGIVDKISKGVSDSRTTAETAMKNLIKAMSNAVTSSTTTFTGIGKKMVQAVSTGISLNAYTVKNAVQSALASAVRNVSTSAFYNVGKYAMQGLARGMNDNAYIVKNASKTAATNALTAANKALKVESPSKEFYKTGRWTMIGLANGIAENSKYAEKQSVKAATDVLDSTNKIMSMLDMEAELNYSPVITPIVDMTNIKTAGNVIGDLLSSDIKMGGTQEVNLASHSFDLMAQQAVKNQEAIFESNRQVVDAINSLRQEVSALPEEIQTQVDLYLDKKLVATSLAPEINKQLGILAKRGGLS